MIDMTRRSALMAIGCAALVDRALAQGTSASGKLANWPAKPVMTILPAGPGGGSDSVLRMVNNKLQGAWHQAVIVDYKPGANSILATDYVAKAPPDGYILGMQLTAMLINPGLQPSLPFDTLRDVVGITQIASGDFGMFANPQFPPNTVPELIAYAKQRPGELSYGTGGVGSGSHLAWEMFNSMAGTKMVHIPYSRGGAAAQLDVIAGRVPLMMDIAFGSMSMVQEGRLKLIAYASPKRSAVHPEVPLISETLPGFSITSSMGYFGPAGMPRELVEKIAADVATGLRDPALRKQMEDLGLEPVGSTPAAYGAFMRSDIEKWAKVIKDANIKVS